MPEDPQKLSKLAESLVADLRHIEGEDPPRSIKRPTQPLAAVLEQLLDKHKIGRESPEHTIRERWPELVGPANAAFSHAVTIERNRLVILTSHAIVRNELYIHRDEILARIHALPGCASVKSLNIRTG